MTDWQSIVATHSAVVWRTAYRLLGNHQDAADCFQETFLSALDVARRQMVRSWPAMLTCLATARALDRVRQRMRERGRSVDVAELASAASPEPGPEQQAETAELVRMFREVGRPVARPPGAGVLPAICQRDELPGDCPGDGPENVRCGSSASSNTRSIA